MLYSFTYMRNKDEDRIVTFDREARSLENAREIADEFIETKREDGWVIDLVSVQVSQSMEPDVK